MFAGRRLLIAAAAAAVSARSALANPAEATGFDESRVINIKPDGFDEHIKDLVPVLVDFYAPWCGHCKHLAPAYARAAEILDERFPTADLTLAKLDATIASEVAQEYEVTGFPTMVLFTQDNKPENLEQLGPHNDVFIATYMANKLLGGHFVTRLSSSDDVNNFRRQSELSCILVAPPGSQLVQMFKEAADKLPVSYMTATADPRAVPPVDKACTAGESCLLVFHESVPSRNRAVAHTDLGNMDAVSMYSWMIQGDIPQELRQGPFLSSWMQQIILLGSSEDTDHESSTARQVFDYAAKGSSVFFSDEVLQTELAHKWIIEAADLDENLQLPTMVMLDIEKGKLNQVVIWNRSLVPAEDEDENAVVEQARTWAHDVTGLEPKLMDKKATISPSDLANNPHLKEAMNTEHGEEIVVYDAKLSKEEQLKAAGHDTKIPDGKDLIELTEADFESKDDYHTWMKNRKRDTEAKRLAEELHEKSSTAVKNKLKPFKMTTGRWGMDASAIENERTQHKYVAVVEMCLSIGDGQGAQKEDDGHSGLDKFMNHVGIWYVNELKGTDMVYTKGCGNDNSDFAAEPHIRIVKGELALGQDPYSWPTHETISTHGLDYHEIRDRLVQYGVKVPNKPHEDV